MTFEGYIVVPKDHAHCHFYGLPPGKYKVHVGDYGWDDGDLFILHDSKKIKVRDLMLSGKVYKHGI